MTPETREIINQAIEIAILKSHGIKPEWFTHHEESDVREFGEIKKGIGEIVKSNQQRTTEYKENNLKLNNICSDNSGQILAIWKTLEKEKKATEIINDVASAGRVFKWLLAGIVFLGSVYGAIKLLLSGWLVNILAR